MLKIALEILKVIIKLLGILIAIPLVILGFLLAKAWFYDSIPKTKIPVAPETFVRRLPGIIIWDANMIQKPESCAERLLNCKVLIPSKNKTIFMTQKQAEQYKKKYGHYCKTVDIQYPKSPSGKLYLNSLSSAYNEQTKKTIHLVTEGHSIEAIDWSPDNRYALYRLEYDIPYPVDDQNWLYIVTDLKTRETYRILSKPEIRMDTCWVSN